MKFNKYDNVNLFWNDIKNLVEKEEWYNTLLIGNCREAMENKNIDMFLATIIIQDKIELIMLYRKPWKLLLYSPTNNYSDEIIKFAAENIFEFDNKLLGVNSEKEVANKFAKYYTELSNLKYTVHTGLRILLLENLEGANLLEDAVCRKANIEDKPILINFIKEFISEALHKEFDDQSVNEKFNKYFNSGYFVLERAGKIVSQATIGRIMKNGKCISVVYTPKEERGKCYAYNLIYRISKELLDSGDDYCVLYTDDSNPISNHVYEKVGYKRKSDWVDIDFM